MKNLFSVRMRAAKEKNMSEDTIHISGGEGLCTYDQIAKLSSELLQKAITHEKGNPDTIHISIEKVKETPIFAPPLTVMDHYPKTVEEGRQIASQLLLNIGISQLSVTAALKHMLNPIPIRGAALLDANTGGRLDQRGNKGVRVSRMDWEEASLKFLQKKDPGLLKERVIEAHALASKVAFYPEIVAELCWSDDPGYTTGYVSGRQIGYHRIPFLKNLSDSTGGRVFFISSQYSEVESLMEKLERQPVLIGWGDKESNVKKEGEDDGFNL